ncbi:hypothetical protein G8764_12875 [Pseudomaricurvus alcaniphilus]|uniref:hypothetical protein n=1 Tax=Pseudomaricurvus alcaniphilus TaxID=1166482 RepID=UPI00140CC1BE|nr:hypothetical protein [Pseudomaricurvus alcaniphilus]NHN38194.1 hypothetical protein [Pseudomaricurvus alcaniphilus]
MYYSKRRNSIPALPRRRPFKALAVSSAITLATLLASASASAQLSLGRQLYAAPFSCGAQRALSVNLPTTLETGQYATSFSAFNASSTTTGVISVFAALPGAAPVFVESYSLPGYGNATTDCADIIAALGVIGVPDAVVGYVHLLRATDDLEVYTTYSRTASSNGGAQATPVAGASVDVERVEPRLVEIKRLLTPLY